MNLDLGCFKSERCLINFLRENLDEQNGFSRQELTLGSFLNPIKFDHNACLKIVDQQDLMY